MAYGFQLRRADGSIALSETETFARLVHIESVANDFSGTFTVPGFNSAKGMFYVQFELWPLRDRDTGNLSIISPRIGAVILPTLDWEDATETMTVSPANVPGGWSRGDSARPDYQVVFIHYR